MLHVFLYASLLSARKFFREPARRCGFMRIQVKSLGQERNLCLSLIPIRILYVRVGYDGISKISYSTFYFETNSLGFPGTYGACACIAKSRGSPKASWLIICRGLQGTSMSTCISAFNLSETVNPIPNLLKHLHSYILNYFKRLIKYLDL